MLNEAGFHDVTLEELYWVSALLRAKA